MAPSNAEVRRRSLDFLKLIGITDDVRDGAEGLIGRAAAAVRGGVTCVQVRLKECTPREIVEITAEMVRTLGVPVFVNDRADLALAAGAAGVHVGPGDLPVKAVRRFVPPDFVIGASFGAEREYANARLADYAGVGPIAVTSSKTDAGAPIGVDGFRRLAARIGVPVVAVGGVDSRLAGELIAAGAAGVAVMRAIFGASDPERAASECRRAIGI